MTTISYKGYQGSASYEDGRIIVKILHIDDLIYDECTDASQVEAIFADLVEDYIQTCLELGKDPCKPYKGSFNVRVSADMHRRIAMLAAQQGKSLNSFVEDALRSHAGREERIAETIKSAQRRAKELAVSSAIGDDFFFSIQSQEAMYSSADINDVLKDVLPFAASDQRH